MKCKLRCHLVLSFRSHLSCPMHNNKFWHVDITCPIWLECVEHVNSDSDQLLIFNQMSLPRSNYDPRRVCLNPFPEITLGKHRRAIGVYLAGALV